LRKSKSITVLSSVSPYLEEIVKITCYLSPACGSEGGLRANIDRALKDEDISADVSVQRIDDQKAADLGLSGSPSILFDGKELQPSAGTGFS